MNWTTFRADLQDNRVLTMPKSPLLTATTGSGPTSQNKNSGHRERLRDKFLADGLEGFHDYEVIELLLTLATPRKDCKKMAKEALKRFKTLPGVLEASPAELSEIAGIGPKNVFGLKFIPAVARRYLQKRLKNSPILSNSKQLHAYLTFELRDKSKEVFLAVFLNAKNKVLAAETLFKGTLTSSSVYPREVVKAALEHRAAAVILAHNHPSGDPVPSPEDLAVTRQLLHALHLVGIVVHEHLIIGADRYYSFADQGHIARMVNELSTL
jgi:DNA repair protein RadC